MESDTERIVIDEARLAEGVDRLAGAITAQYADLAEAADPGAVVFLADLMRKLPIKNKAGNGGGVELWSGHGGG